jgi:H+-transporting ATPase
VAFVAIVFGNQATTYTNRERRHLWSSRPGGWVVASSIGDILIASTLAIGGIAMAPLPVSTVLGVLAAAIVFAIVLDLAKVPIFNRLGITRRSARRQAGECEGDCGKRGIERPTKTYPAH